MSPTANEDRREAMDTGATARETLRRAKLPAIQFERWDIEGVDLNFEMHHGELNINAIARCLAEADAFAKKDAPFAALSFARTGCFLLKIMM